LVTQSSHRAQTEGIISRFSDVARSHLDVRIHLVDIYPWEPRMAESIRCQQPFVQRFPGDSLTRQMEQACERLELGELSPTHGLKFFYPEQARARQNQLPER
jgi:hypothetical protein